MIDLPEELFEIGKPGERREYIFINLKGEEEFVFLNFGDRLTTKRCALDGAYIVAHSGDPHTVEECPVCGKYFSVEKISSIKSINESVVPYAQFRIEALKEELNKLEAILALAGKPDNKIKISNLQNSLYNKANLSAQEPKIVRMRDYKSKEMKEAEERFYHLSDHLFPDNSDEEDTNPDKNA